MWVDMIKNFNLGGIVTLVTDQIKKPRFRRMKKLITRKKRSKIILQPDSDSIITQEPISITVNYDVGFENALYIRGNGASLSWEKGALLKNIDSTTWTYEIKEPVDKVEYKILINDTAYELGENRCIHSGQQVKVFPKF